MKVLSLAILFVTVISAKIQREITKDVGVAVGQIIQKSFTEDIHSVDIVTFGSTKKFFDQTLTTIMTRGEGRVFKVFRLDPRYKLTYVNFNAAIFLFDSFDSFMRFTMQQFLENRKSKAESHSPHKKKNIVYAHNVHEQEINSVHYLYLGPFQRFVFQENDTLNLKEIQLASPRHCKSIQWKTINTFGKRFKIWISTMFESKPVRNFHRCEVVFKITKTFPYESYYNFNDGKGFHVEGINIALYSELAKALNFTAFFNPFLKNESGHEYYLHPSKGVEVQCINVLQMKSNYFLTQPHDYNVFLYLVPPGEPYTNFEKLFLAFDEATWIMIGVTFSIAFFTIVCLIFMSRVVQERAFGSQVKAPWFNVISVFFGISQHVVPRRSFARFLLMSFIVYSLIIRTAYQGKSFEFLQKDVRKSPIRSLKEMNEKGMKLFIVGNIFSQHYTQMPKAYKR